MTERFLLLTVPKSGSNYFGSQISNLSDVIFLNTLYSKGFLTTHFNIHNTGPKSKTGVLTELFKLILSDKQVYNELIRLRTENAIDWLMSIMQMDPGGYLGAKIHPYLDIWYSEKNSETDNIEIKFALDPELIVNYLAPKYYWRIFTMSRKNIHEQLASSFLSLKTKYFGQDDLPEEPELFRKGKLLNEDIDKHKNILSVYKKCYQYINYIKEKDNITHIWYEDLINNNISTEVTRYFGVNNLPKVNSKKLFRREYSDAFEDYRYFKKVINEL